MPSTPCSCASKATRATAPASRSCASRSFGFPQEIQTRIKLLFERERDRKLTDPETGEHPAPWTIEEICHLDFVLGELFAQAANRLIADAGMKNDDVDLIAAAGQTIWHRPRPTTEPSTADLPWLDEPITTRSTLAIGQAAVIAERTGIITMGDLRVRDVAAGGHGAPLVAVLRLGPAPPSEARARDAEHRRHRQRHVHPAERDARRGGRVRHRSGQHGHRLADVSRHARRGNVRSRRRARRRAARVREDVLAWCMSDPYFQLKPPKTTGRERFGRQFAARMAERFSDVAPDDLIATATAFTAESIAHAYREFIGRHVDEMIVAGGGAKNPALLRMLRERFAGRGDQGLRVSPGKRSDGDGAHRQRLDLRPRHERRLGDRRARHGPRQDLLMSDRTHFRTRLRRRRAARRNADPHR